jgi:hypothetical protein
MPPPPDGRSRLPTNVFEPRTSTPLWKSALTADPIRLGLPAHAPPPEALRPGSSITFAPTDPATVEANRTRLFGPTYAALSQAFGTDSDLSSELRGEAALGVVPALLLATVAKPGVDRVYQVLDHIPEAIRRPFEKGFAILVDNAVAAVTGAAQTALERATRSFVPGGSPTPSRVQLQVDAYSQLETSCGETAVAMIMKAAGEPVLIGDVDTQVPGPFGIPGVGGAPNIGGNNFLVDREFARRGLTAISGVGTVSRLKQYVASGFPVMVSLGWANGGGHFAVVSGYDDRAGTFTVKNYTARGNTDVVRAADFTAAWGRHQNLFTAVVPQRDPRLEKLLKAGEMTRPLKVYSGFSITDFWVDPKRLFVETAYRYVNATTDVTLRVSFNSDEFNPSDPGTMRWLNGSIAVRRKVTDGWFVGFRVEKLSLRKQNEDWKTFRTTPIGATATVEGPGFKLAVGAERGAFQASLAAELGRAIADLGLRVNLSVDTQGEYQLMGALAGTW